MERLLGRGLAICVHPWAAWRVGSTPVRIWLVGAYFAVGYLARFLGLQLAQTT
jgi:hypothetical protein